MKWLPLLGRLFAAVLGVLFPKKSADEKTAESWQKAHDAWAKELWRLEDVEEKAHQSWLRAANGLDHGGDQQQLFAQWQRSGEAVGNHRRSEPRRPTDRT